MLDPSHPDIRFFREIDSTNSFVIREFDRLPDGAIIAAASQTAGKGRLGTRWLSTPGKGIYMTMVMKTVKDPLAATIAFSLAALDAVREAVPGIQAAIKWPNDIYSGDCKLAGMLAEGKMTNGSLAGVAAGIGVNVAYTREELAALGRPATSLNLLANREFSPDLLLNSFAFFVLRRYIILIAGADFFDEWRSENFLIGRDVVLFTSSGRECGRAIAIDDSGRLVVRFPDGSIRAVSSADVRIGRL